MASVLSAVLLVAATAIVTVCPAAKGPPTVANCNIDVHQHNWSAVLSCDVHHTLASAGVYQFRLLELRHASFLSDNQRPYFLRDLIQSDPSRSSELRIHEQRSFPDPLQAYLNTTDNLTLYRGRLEYSWRLSSANKGLQYATVVFCPSPNPYDCVIPSMLLTNLPKVAMPGAPSHNCTQLSHIPENGTVICTCSTDSVGSPPGRLMWLLDNEVWSRGQYGVSQLSLSTESMTRQQNLKQATCRLDWIDPQDLQLPLNMAYGPDTVDLRIHHLYVTHNNERLLVIECQVTGMTPMTPDMVKWEGPCQGQQGFTCTLDLHQTDAKGKTVTCRVTNSANNGHTAEVVKLIEADLTLTPVDWPSDEEVTWTAVCGVVFNAVIVTLVMVVMTTWLFRGAFHYLRR